VVFEALRRCATRSCRAPSCTGCATARCLSRGQPAEEFGVAKGAVRVSSVSLSGKQITLTYVEPGLWFGDIALFDGMPRTHDANAHGPTTLLVVRKPDFKELLAQHVELYDALLRLNCRRLRLMFDAVGTSTHAHWHRAWPNRSCCSRAATASTRARNPHQHGWRRKIWRSCSARRASA
jgi:CRP-like cAMP-binding protein